MSATVEGQDSPIITRNFVMLAGYGMMALAMSLMMVTGLPLYLHSQGWQPTEIGSVLGWYFLAALFVRPFAGRESDKRGRRALLISGGLCLLVPCPFYLVSSSPALILVLRAAQGLGWAMATTTTAAMLSEIVPKGRVGTGMGIFGIVNGLGFTFGPLLGAHLLRVGGGTAFILTASAMAVVVLGFALLITNPPVQGPRHGLTWSDAVRVTRMLILPLTVTAAVSFGYGAIQTFLPLYARASGVTNPGVFFTVFSILLFGSRPVMGRLSDVWGRRRTASLLMIIISATFLTLSYSASLPFLTFAGALYGIGHGAVYTVLMALMADLTPPKDRGFTFGIFGTAIDVGITSGTFLFGLTVPLIDYRGSFFMAAIVVLASLPLLMDRRSQMAAAVSHGRPAS